MTNLTDLLAQHRLYGEEGDDQYLCGCGELSPAEALEVDFGELLWHEAHLADVITKAEEPDEHDHRIAVTVLRETGEAMLSEQRHLRDGLLEGWSVAVQRILSRARSLERRADRFVATRG